MQAKAGPGTPPTAKRQAPAATRPPSAWSRRVTGAHVNGRAPGTGRPPGPRRRGRGSRSPYHALVRWDDEDPGLPVKFGELRLGLPGGHRTYGPATVDQARVLARRAEAAGG